VQRALSVDGKKYTWARSHEHLSEICDVVLRLLAASAVRFSSFEHLSLAAGIQRLWRMHSSAPSFRASDGAVPESEDHYTGENQLGRNRCRVLGAIPGQTSTHQIAWLYDVLEQVLARSLDAMRDLPSFMIVDCGNSILVDGFTQETSSNLLQTTHFN
jgi:hypothetical protein